MPLVLFAAERTAGDKFAWDDEIGKTHHFPNQYRSKIKTGEKFVYYRGVRRADGKRGTAEYFGAGKVGAVWPDHAANAKAASKRNWAWFCEIENYTPFASPVPRKLDGKLFEEIADNLWGVGVRTISEETYHAILQVSSASHAPGATGQAVSASTTRSVLPRIFASAVFTLDLDRWGAWGFTDKGTRDKLADAIGPDDYVLSVAVRKPPALPHEQGRLLTLMKIGPEPILTEQLVEPALWQEVLSDNGGLPRWPYGFPILSAERFTSPPLRSDLLPRLDADNLHMKLARHFVELTPAEVAAVLSQDRAPVRNIYSSPSSAFASKLMKAPKGPPPAVGTRTLSVTSGSAATYCLELTGSALNEVVGHLTTDSLRMFKVGFSNDPQRRLAEINAYLPCPDTLCWKVTKTQWHHDEINAFAMEQRLFELLQAGGASFVKGEVFLATDELVETIWQEAKGTAVRPNGEIKIAA